MLARSGNKTGAPGATGGLSASVLPHRPSRSDRGRFGRRFSSTESFWLKPAARNLSATARHAAFTLLELMMAMVILGLGLVMVATIFPVAWTRAKELNEVTARQTMVPTVESTLRGLVPVSDTLLTRAGFAGDLVYVSDCDPGWIAAYSDTRVRALNTQNVQVNPRQFVAEDPWLQEMMPGTDVWIETPLNGPLSNACPQLNAQPPVNVAEAFSKFSYHTPRIDFGQRWYPPLPKRDPASIDPSGKFNNKDPVWDSKLDTRRFAWAVFHRLRKPVGPAYSTNTVAYARNDSSYARQAEEAAVAAGREKEFDVYFVSLRRTRPTDRFARQGTSKLSALPNPNVLATAANVVPEAQVPGADVMLPTPWRVQIEVPQFPSVQMAAHATGVPTEVLIPPNNFSGSEAASIMLVQMFPPGAFFIDEINGQVYKVAQRRIVDDVGALAVLTLDREITLEDIDIPNVDNACDLRFANPTCTTINPAAPAADPEELLRTVWVFPPSSEQREDGNVYPTFDGPPPVVGVEIRTMTFLP